MFSIIWIWIKKIKFDNFLSKVKGCLKIIHGLIKRISTTNVLEIFFNPSCKIRLIVTLSFWYEDSCAMTLWFLFFYSIVAFWVRQSINKCFIFCCNFTTGSNLAFLMIYNWSSTPNLVNVFANVLNCHFHLVENGQTII